MGYIPQVFTCVYGCWLCRLVVLAVTARRLLVGGTREASASSAVWSDHSGPYPYVFARESLFHTWAYARYLIFSLPLLLILMAEGIDWLARHVWMRKGAAVVAWGLTAIIVFVLGTLGSRAVSRQETMAVCPRSQVSAYANAEKRCDRRGMEHWVHTLAVLRTPRRSHYAARQIR